MEEEGGDFDAEGVLGDEWEDIVNGVEADF